MIPKNFTVAEIDELIEAKKYIFSGKPYPLKIVSEEIKKLIGKVEWANGADLSEDLQKITSTDSLEKTEKVLSGWKQEVSEKPVESTVPQKEQLEKLKEEAEKRRVAAKESVQSARTKQEQKQGTVSSRFIKEYKRYVLKETAHQPVLASCNYGLNFL